MVQAVGVSSVNNIQKLREQRGWSRPDLARRMDTSPQQIERLEKGQRKLTQDWIDKAAVAFSVHPTAIISDDPAHPPAPTRPSSTAIDDGDAVPVTALDLSVSMGPGTIVEDFVESEPVYMDLKLLQIITRTPSDRLRLIKGIGDSMEPTLRTGDRILVDINDRQLARINGIYWIDHFGLHGIKRLRGSAAGKIMVMSDNQNVSDFEADAADVRIHGRVIWFGREL